MKTLMTTTALALTLAAGTAYAESHTNGEEMQQNLENAGENLKAAGENAADATANAADDAAEATENAAEDATQATENAAEELANEADQAADATAEAAADATDATMETADGMMDNMSNMIRVRDILGGDIYSADSKNGVVEFSTRSYDQMGEDWADIGEIEDIVLSADGKIIGVVAEVGGFLNIGDKHVFLPMDNVKLVPVEDATYKVVVGYSENQLEEMKSVDEAFYN
jgi:hypothetical protein